MKLLSAALLSVLCLQALDRQPAADYRARRVRLAEKLSGGIAIVFAAPEPVLDFMPYRQDADFFYLTGWNEPGAALLIESAAAGRKYREMLFLPTRNLRRELYTGVKLDAATPDAPRTAGVDEVRPLTELPSILNQLVSSDMSVLGKISSQPDLPASKSLLAWVATTLGFDSAPAVSNAGLPIGDLRAIKDPGELALLKTASNISAKAQFTMMRSVDPGVKERAVAGAIIAKLMAEGCERPSYSPIVGSGVNATVLHYSENSGTMQSGDLVVVDAAAECSMYASDITRTLPVNGRFTPRQREVYDIVLGAQKAAMDAFVPGKSRVNDPKHKFPDSLDTIAWNYMNAHGKDLHGEPIGKYFIHGIGHPVGIDVHDPWDYTKPIEKGMVFTIEPGIYIPEEKIGIRIEDTFYVDPDGKLVNLTEALPKNAEEVEKQMRKER